MEIYKYYFYWFFKNWGGKVTTNSARSTDHVIWFRQVAEGDSAGNCRRIALLLRNCVADDSPFYLKSPPYILCLLKTKMNIFRLLGDLAHLLAIEILLLKIWKSRSCTGKQVQNLWTKIRVVPILTHLSCFFLGFSGKSQFLLALVYTTRYLDLFTNFISLYNTFMKVQYIYTHFLNRVELWCI